MKLSEKGLGKIQKWQSTVALGFPMHPSEINFEPDDFQGCVVLTLKEAKLVQGGIRLLALRSNIYLEGGLIKMLQELLDNVDKQIEQTEKSNEQL